jgi:hypothetical protein
LHLPPLSLHLEFQREKKKRINQSAISPIPSHCCSSIQFDSVQFNPIHPRPQGFEEKETEEKTPQPQLTSHVKNTIPNFTKKKKNTNNLSQFPIPSNPFQVSICLQLSSSPTHPMSSPKLSNRVRKIKKEKTNYLNHISHPY